MTENGGEYFIAVHSGAGYHHPDNDEHTKKALRLACKKAHKFLQQSPHPITSDSGAVEPNGNESPCLALVEQAIISLEDDSSFNAGYGSNLTLDGTVECDAALYAAAAAPRDSGSSHAQSLFGSVGAVSGIKNPISAARCILEYSKKADKLHRLPPMTLVSDGAVNFIKQHAGSNAMRKTQILPAEDMISPSAMQTWIKWNERLGGVDIVMDEVDKEDAMQDTVGAVAWHSRDGFAAGVSSGGILLKFPGRLGEAGIFGAGCWAKHMHELNSTGMACSISGTGEEIVRANLARRIGDGYNSATDPHELLHDVLVKQFWVPARKRGLQDPAAGVLLITRETDENDKAIARVWCGFTTASMAIAFASSKDPRPKAYILRRPETKRLREEVHVYITALKV